MKYIYKITNTVNNKIYIGQTNNVSQRWYKHNYNARSGRRSHLYDAIRKYGIDNFTIEIIEECFDDMADDRERFWIAFYNSINREYGYNQTFGGTGSNTWELNDHKDETSRKIAEHLKGRPQSLKTREKLLLANKGKIISQEQREKISQTLKEGYRTGRIKKQIPPHYDRTGSHHSQETKDAISKLTKGKTYEEIHGIELANIIKQKHRDHWMADKNPNYKDIDVNEIILLIKQGYQNKEIAHMFNVSKQTIWNKLKSVGLTARQIRRNHNASNV